MISYAQPQHTIQIRSLWKAVFQDSDTFLDLYFEKIYKPERCVISIYNNDLCAALQLLPYTFIIKGVEVNGIYIFAVMTKPLERKKGHMSDMLSFVFKELKDEVDFVFLIPQEKELFSMYHKFGFENAFKYPKDEINLPVVDSKTISPSIEEAYDFYFRENKSVDFVYQTYNQFEFIANSLRLEGGELLAVETDNKIQAISFALPVQNRIRILDIVSENDVAKKKLLAGIRNKYKIENACVSSSELQSSLKFGMVKILQSEHISVKDLENVYLPLMMSE